MTDRIIDIAESGAYLKLAHGQMIIERPEQPPAQAALEDVAVVVAAHPRITLTQPLLAAMAEAGTVLVVCDGSKMPAAMLTPLAGNTIQTERMAAQLGAGEPLRKRLWQALVRSKIEAQAGALRQRTGGDLGLKAMAGRVRSGDTGNLEAQAARRYWPAIFGDPEFRRRPGGPAPNGLLNYGYGVLRAVAARAVAGAGLHPSVGLHHCNRYDAFCLADDLMEVFRPEVDLAVAEIVATHGMDSEVTRATKPMLLESLTGQYEVEGEQRTLFDAAARLAVSLARSFSAKKNMLVLPKR